MNYNSQLTTASLVLRIYVLFAILLYHTLKSENCAIWEVEVTLLNSKNQHFFKEFFFKQSRPEGICGVEKNIQNVVLDVEVMVQLDGVLIMDFFSRHSSMIPWIRIALMLRF